MTLAPTYEAFKRETSGKTFFRKKNPLSPWALDKGYLIFMSVCEAFLFAMCLQQQYDFLVISAVYF